MHKGILAVLFCLGSGLPAASTEEWTRWGGPEQTLRARSDLGFESAPSVSWHLAWQRPFGSGYSAVLAMDNFLISAAATDQGDAVFALNPADGEVIWRTVIAPVWEARNGSDDGPFSTPTVANHHVYFMHPSGLLACLALDDGRVKWRRDMVKEFGGIHPKYGYSAVPVVTGDLVIAVAGGTEGRTVVGLNRATGKTQWVSGIEDRSGYQNPVLTRLRGKEQVLISTNQHVLGMDPTDGTILWQAPLGFDADSTVLVPFDESDFFVKARNLSIRYSLDPDGKTLRERWRQNIFKRGYCQPIEVGGYLYGFDARFLTCVNAADGQVVWKSRPPGGDVLAMVDDVLLIPDRQGELTAVRATPAGYRPLGTIPMSTIRRNFTPPVFYKGKVYMRDLNNLYAFDLKPSQKAPVTAQAAGNASGVQASAGAISQFVRNLPQQANPRVAISQFLSQHPTMPVVSADGYAHFFVHGKRDDLVIIGDMTGKIFPEAMHRIGQTDLFHRAFPIQEGTRWEYKYREFADDFLDPLNPNKFTSDSGDWNLLIHGSWQEPEWVKAAPRATSAEIREFSVKHPQTDEDYAYAVFLPPSYAQKPEQKFPLIVFTRGDTAVEHGKLVQMFAKLQGEAFAEAVVVFCKFPNTAWWWVNHNLVQDMVSTRVLPKIEADFRITSDPAGRVMVTQAFHLQNAAYLAWGRPGGFGNLIVQSPMINPDLINRNLAALAVNQNGAKAVIDWSAHDGYNPAWHVDSRQAAPQLLKVWGAKGIQVIEHNRHDGYGWVGWRKAMPELLAKILPAK